MTLSTCIRLLPLLFLIACSSEREDKKNLLFATLAPYKFLVEQIGGDLVEVQLLIPPGVSPHTYEPTLQQVRSLQGGLIWFQMGEPFEKRILPAMQERNPGLLVVDLCEEETLPSCPHCCHAHLQDRHVWLSPTLLISMARKTEELLSQRFPEEKAYFAERADRFCAECALVQNEIQERLTSLKGGLLLVSHPAFGYFCKDFQLEQLSVEHAGGEPRPRHLQKILEKAKEHPVSLALALPQYNNKGVTLLAEELKVPLSQIDPYAANCLDTIRLLAKEIVHE
ncbi:MAG: zinc ABC transporter substrate-binding protein [Verrucomicrobiota bacterium]|nr:zinc ABC transporter substrate-binding protein [Verrucomicrobiota bacterium]